MNKLLTTDDVHQWARDVEPPWEFCVNYGLPTRKKQWEARCEDDRATAARLAQGQRLLEALEETEATLEKQACYCICEEPCERCNDLNAYSRLRDALKEP